MSSWKCSDEMYSVLLSVSKVCYRVRIYYLISYIFIIHWICSKVQSLTGLSLTVGTFLCIFSVVVKRMCYFFKHSLTIYSVPCLFKPGLHVRTHSWSSTPFGASYTHNSSSTPSGASYTHSWSSTPSSILN